MKYRAEIDGLRTVALIPVILFHAGFDHFSGGFVGVDVFFVISGYLITSIILSDMEHGTFSLLNFYERRARRILPALFLVMSVSIPFAWSWFLPIDMMNFSGSLIAVSIFASNIFFWRQGGYWATANELKPLLHTWSLAVEEQYYFLFPLFLMIMWRFRKRWILLSLMVIAVISLFLSQWGAYNKPPANFFLLPTRCWEFAIGACIAFYFLYHKQGARSFLHYKSVDEALGITGLLMIGYAVFTFDKTVPFPSIYALIPTIGAGLIVTFSSPQTLVGRLLGTKLLVGIGLISYSTYLWHQPLFAFARMRMLDGVSPRVYFFLSFFSLLLAYFTWRFIELPYRNMKKFTWPHFFLGIAILSLFMVIFGSIGQITAGFPSRIPGEVLHEVLQIQKWSKTNNEIKCSDISETSFDNLIGKKCIFNPERQQSYAIWGDSHADVLSGELANLLDQENSGLIHFSLNACPPTLGIKSTNFSKSQCLKFNTRVIQYIYSKNIDTVILLSRWTLYLEGKGFNNGEGGIEFATDIYAFPMKENKNNLNKNKRIESVGLLYRETIEQLLRNGKRVILIYPIPEVGWDVPSFLSRNVLFNHEVISVLSTNFNVFKERTRNVHAQLNKINAHPNLLKVYPENLFCDSLFKKRCVASIDGKPLYIDDDHLNTIGASMLAKEVINKMEDKGWIK